MKYVEPSIEVLIPISALRRIEESLYRDVGLAHMMRRRGHHVPKASIRETEEALQIIEDSLIEYEATLIIGDTLDDAYLRSQFPTKRKRNNKNKNTE